MIYVPLSTTGTVAAGQATVDLEVMPVADALVEASETVVLTLTDGLTYNVGSPNWAKVTIQAGSPRPKGAWPLSGEARRHALDA